jgi:hypothetical protein
VYTLLLKLLETPFYILPAKIEQPISPVGCNPMLVKTLQGIPFLCDSISKTIYAYERVPTQPPLALGTYDAEKETYTLVANWQELYAPRVAAYRASEKPRSRVPSTAK